MTLTINYYPPPEGGLIGPQGRTLKPKNRMGPERPVFYRVVSTQFVKNNKESLSSSSSPNERNPSVTKFQYDIGIIGGGAAGLTTAAGTAQLGAKTLLVEKAKSLGGDCLHFGCVPSKTLIRSAHVYHLLRNTTSYGLPSVDLPPVDFRQIRDRIRSVIKTIEKHDSEERFCSLGARVVFGPARFVDEHTIEVDGARMTAGKWVIATGSLPAAPPIAGLADIEYLTNKEIFFLESLPDSMIVLGAGPIGIEMCQAFTRLGSKVTVIDRAEQILPREDSDMAHLLMSILADEGIDFQLGVQIQEATNNGNQKEVIIKTSEGKLKHLKADHLLVAAGRRPNYEGLGLEQIGVETTPSGIRVDDRLRTTQKHIFAAGDVSGGPQFTHAAGYMGSIVISNAVFRLPRKVDYTYLPWCTYTDPELASIGMNEKAARQAGIEPRVYIESLEDNDRSLAEGRLRGRLKLLLDPKDKPIGVQILAPRAGDLIAEWVAALNGKVKLSTIAAAIHPYPTLGEINKKAAGSHLATKIFSAKVKKGLKFFFNLKGRACNIQATG